MANPYRTPGATEESCGVCAALNPENYGLCHCCKNPRGTHFAGSSHAESARAVLHAENTAKAAGDADEQQGTTTS